MTRNECNRILLERLSFVLQMDSLCTGDSLQELMQLGIGQEEAMAAVLLSRMGLDPEENLGKEIYRGYLPKMLKQGSPEEVEKDPFVQAVGNLEFRQGNKRLAMDTLEPYQLFIRNDFEIDGEGRVLPQLGFYDRPIRFPVLLENERSWMSAEPNEIATLRPLAEKAHGKVVMLGLGLGYYAFHALLSKKVRSVTVVERDQEIISLFEKVLLPHFPRKEAVSIVKADAFSFVRNELPKLGADTVLVDLWKHAGDGMELYSRMKQMEFSGPEWQYWIEKTIKYYLEEKE